jgi:glucose-6-phosphate isomerase
MALKQSIDQAKPANFADVLSRTDGALKWLRDRHADGKLPLLRLPEQRDDIATILGYAGVLRDGTSDVIFLGTGGSSLGGQTLAQLSGYAVPGVGALRDPPRVHFMDNLDPESYATLLQRLPLKTSRFVAVSKSGGTGETLMQTIAALDAVKAATLDPHAHFLGITEPAKPGKSNGLRAMLGAHKIEMMEHDTGVGGRFSVLTNVGLLPAAVCGLDIGAIRAGAGDALAPVLAGKPPAEVPAAVGRGAVDCARADQADRRADGLFRPARAHDQVVRPTLGREPRQGRQGHHPYWRARAGGSAQPVAALYRRPARQAVHGGHRHTSRQRPAHDRRAVEARRRA